MSKRILIVDDDVLLSETIGNYLSLLQYQVFLANSTNAAIQCVNLQKPQLIISEFNTLAINGIEILDFIHHKSSNQGISFIFLTSKNQSAAVINGMAAGADAYLTKPFDFDLLHKVIKKLFTPKKNTLEKSI